MLDILIKIIIISFLGIAFGNILFPEQIICDSFLTALKAAVSFTLFEIVITMVILGILLLIMGMVDENHNSLFEVFWIVAILLVIIGPIWGNYMALVVMENKVAGFAIASTKARCIITAIITLCNADDFSVWINSEIRVRWGILQAHYLCLSSWKCVPYIYEYVWPL